MYYIFNYRLMEAKFMELLMEIYMYIKNEIKNYLMVKKVRKKFQELSEINGNIENLYKENHQFFESDEIVVKKVLEVDKNNNIATNDFL